MSLTVYQASVPGILQTLNALLGILTKAQAHCEARKIDPIVMINQRLFPDMHPFARQSQITTDQAKGLMARMTGREVPAWPDTETSFDQLKARVQKALDYIQSFKPEDLDGTETRQVTLTMGGNDMTFPGAVYAFNIVMPNFYFHATAAYSILRHSGVEIGKRDFMNAANR
jgi:hypothetical protein